MTRYIQQIISYRVNSYTCNVSRYGIEIHPGYTRYCIAIEGLNNCILYLRVAFAMEQDIPDYDMDSEDEKWVAVQSRKMDLTPLQFEEMMDRLEKSSGQTVVTLNEAKALLKEDDDLIIAVFDYWLNKRLKTVSFTCYSNKCAYI